MLDAILEVGLCFIYICLQNVTEVVQPTPDHASTELSEIRVLGVAFCVRRNIGCLKIKQICKKSILDLVKIITPMYNI